MKILLVSTSCFNVPPPTYAGLERIVYDLAVGLCELGNEVTVAATKGSKARAEGEKYDVIETVDFTGDLRAFGQEGDAYKIYKDKMKDFDIVHSHNWLAHPYLYKQEHPELKVTHTHHGHINWRTPPPVKYPNLCAISNYMALEYSSRLGISTRFVHNGIDLGLYKFQKEKGERLLYVGRFARYKCSHIAIDIARRMRMPLDLLGGTTFVEDPRYVNQIYDQCDGKQIRWFGETPHDIKVKLMQNAKCLLFPSQMGEPFGLCAAEAMATGTPVVALDDGAIKEVVEHEKTGFVVKSVDEMCEAVKHVDRIKPEDCRRRVEEKFGRQAMSKSYLSLYSQILSGAEW